MNILVVSPHPDDAEIGCGGMIAKRVSQGHTVDIVVAVGEGDLKMLGSGRTVPFSQREREQAAAAAVLGINKVHWLGLARASRLDELSLGDMVGPMDQILKGGKYQELYLPLPSHAQDHNYCWEACMAATRPGTNDAMAVFGYEQPTQYHGVQMVNQFGSRHYVVFTEEHLRAKVESIEAHESQVEGRGLGITSVNAVRELCSLRGSEANGSQFAERYVPIHSVDF